MRRGEGREGRDGKCGGTRGERENVEGQGQRQGKFKIANED